MVDVPAQANSLGISSPQIPHSVLNKQQFSSRKM
jgi:hypothetical protein